MTSPFLLRLTNTLAYFFFLGSGIYSVAGPDGFPDTYAKHETYLTPAPWAFAIWGVIHFLFFGFIVWQWFGDSNEVVVNAFGSWFFIAALCTSLWSTLWATDHLFLSLILLCFASASITLIYHQLSIRPAPSFTQSLFVHAPISLYHGWLVYVIWLNILALFIRTGSDGHKPEHPGLLINVVVGLILAQLTATAIAYTEYKGAVGDVPGAFTIAWALFAVSARQPAAFIKWASFACGILVTIYAFVPLVRGRPLTGNAGERESLLHAPNAGGSRAVSSEEAIV
ncbi:hypothetical protein HK097_011076 [Rhizophlyctis rosea]|uniref:DUF1774-domain-containing protein n=1 Tax=Rhizophlyctis rosea TaxID=64517 RepID=A0AAD5X2P4_9FUNG|nr:hypothetical protein HK097_011076 [Rhizophlyctis rosea]